MAGALRGVPASFGLCALVALQCAETNGSPVGDQHDKPILWHYTDDQALHGMLVNGEVWFCDPRFMNDARELVHFAELLVRATSSAAYNVRQHWLDAGRDGKTLDALIGRWASVIARWPQHPQTFDQSRYTFKDERFYLFCLSEEGDQLSQWRAYGGGMYCVGFDWQALEKATGSELFKVDYDQEPRQSEISTIEGSLRRFAKHGIDGEVLEYGAGEFMLQIPFRRFVATKHPGFQEEKEWRLVRRGEGDISPSFHPRGYLVPMLKVKLFAEADEQKTRAAKINAVLHSVRIGPSLDKDRANYSLHRLRRALEYK